MSAYNGHYAPQETSLFDEQMSAFEPSFTDSAMHAGSTDAYPVVDDAPFRPPSADGLFQPYPLESAATSRGPSPLATYPGAVAPFSQVYSSHLSPFSPNGAFPPSASTSSSGSPAYPSSFSAGVPPATTLAVQAAIHHQQRAVQQHPGFLDPRQQAELLQAHQGGVAPATITPSQVQHNSFSAASTPSTSTSASPPPPPPVASSSKAGGKSTKSSSSSTSLLPTKKANGGAVRPRHTPSASPAPPSAVASTVRKYEYNPDEWNQILPSVRSLLSAKRLQASPLATAPKLLKDLRFFSHETRSDSPWGDTSDVPPEGRAEVLHCLLKYARDEFWHVFLEVVQDKPATAATASSSSSTKGKGKEDADEPQQLAGIKSDALDLLQSWLEGASKAVVREKATAGGAATSGKDRKRKELEQATLALVLQVSLPSLSLLSGFASTRGHCGKGFVILGLLCGVSRSFPSSPWFFSEALRGDSRIVTRASGASVCLRSPLAALQKDTARFCLVWFLPQDANMCPTQSGRTG